MVRQNIKSNLTLTHRDPIMTQINKLKLALHGQAMRNSKEKNSQVMGGDHMGLKIA